MPPNAETTRAFCTACRRKPVNCYCAHVRRIDPRISFAILLHSREARKHIATGRLAHRCLESSHLLAGYEYERDERLRALLADPARHCVTLYPGKGAANLTELDAAGRAALTPAGKKLTVIVIDGTWTTARKTMQRTACLRALPCFAFDPPAPSRIRIRQQPRPECWTTIEAIHQVIELLGASSGFDVASRAHDGLLRALDAMVDRQVELARERAGRDC